MLLIQPLAVLVACYGEQLHGCSRQPIFLGVLLLRMLRLLLGYNLYKHGCTLLAAAATRAAIMM
jgi:hypothetical protein